MTVRYGPNEVNREERERFWNDLDRIGDRARNEYRLCVLRGQNIWIADKVRTRIIDPFGVLGENDN